MINTTQSFYDNSIRAYRSTNTKVTCYIEDLGASEDLSSITPNEYTYYKQDYLLDDNDTFVRYGTCEKNQFFLDGNTELLPQTLTGKENIGWWSSLIPDNYSKQNTYYVNPTLTIQFDSLHSSPGITLVCERTYYRMTCEWYNGNTLIDSQSITPYVANPNDLQSVFVVFDKSVENFNKIVISGVPLTPLLMWQEDIRLKVNELYFGIVKTFDGDSLKSASVKEMTSLMSNKLEPNELDFSVFNYEKEYDALNNDSLFKWFKSGQKVKAQSSVLNIETDMYEWIPMGTYYISESSVNSGMLNVKAYGILNVLNSQQYYSPMFSNKSVEYILRDILGSYSFYVHDNCKNIQLSGYIPQTTKKEALKYVAIASNSVVKEGRDGVLYIYQATEDLSHNQIITDDTIYVASYISGIMCNVQPMPLLADAEEDVLTIDSDTRMSSVETDTIGVYDTCSVTYKTYTLGESKSLFEDDVTTDASGYAIIKYNKPVSVTSTSGGGTFYNYADCTILEGTPNTTYSVTIVGSEYEITDNIASAVVDVEPMYYDVKQTITLDEFNTLITDSTRAISCANWYLNQLQRRLDISFDWWSVATVEASDYINIDIDGEIHQMQTNEIDYNLLNLEASVKGII